jgi:hypothetical protein
MSIGGQMNKYHGHTYAPLPRRQPATRRDSDPLICEVQRIIEGEGLIVSGVALRNVLKLVKVRELNSVEEALKAYLQQVSPKL